MPTTVERAFQLARGSECHSIADIKRMLTVERYSNIEAHPAGPSLQEQLKALLR